MPITLRLTAVILNQLGSCEGLRRWASPAWATSPLHLEYLTFVHRAVTKPSDRLMMTIVTRLTLADDRNRCKQVLRQISVARKDPSSVLQNRKSSNINALPHLIKPIIFKFVAIISTGGSGVLIHNRCNRYAKRKVRSTPIRGTRLNAHKVISAQMSPLKTASRTTTPSFANSRRSSTDLRVGESVVLAAMLFNLSFHQHGDVQALRQTGHWR